MEIFTSSICMHVAYAYLYMTYTKLYVCHIHIHTHMAHTYTYTHVIYLHKHIWHTPRNMLSACVYSSYIHIQVQHKTNTSKVTYVTSEIWCPSLLVSYMYICCLHALTGVVKLAYAECICTCVPTYLCHLYTYPCVGHMHIGMWHIDMWCICTHRYMTHTHVCLYVTNVYGYVYIASTYIYTYVTYVHMHMWYGYICYMCTNEYAHLTWLLSI